MLGVTRRVFKCPACGNIAIAFKRSDKKTPQGHRKSLYCWKCKKKTMHIQIVSLEPIRIEKHGRTTVVFWGDGTATAVRRQAEDEDNEYSAFCAAVTKRVYGTNSCVKSLIQELTVKEPEPKSAADAMEDIGKALDAFSKAVGIDDACPVDKPCGEKKPAVDWDKASLNEKAKAQYEAHQKDMWICPECGKAHPWQKGPEGRFAFCFKCRTAGQEKIQQ